MSAKLHKAMDWYIDQAVAEAKNASQEAREPFTGKDEQAMRAQLREDLKRADPEQLIALYESSQQGRHH